MEVPTMQIYDITMIFHPQVATRVGVGMHVLHLVQIQETIAIPEQVNVKGV